MGKFQIGMPATGVLKIILAEQNILRGDLIVHPVGLNWSQKYQDKEKKDHIIEAYKDFEKKIKVYSFWSDKFKKDLNEIVNILNDEEVVSICSKVNISFEKRHIPMMNFHPEKGYDLSSIKKIIKEKIFPDKEGVILDSGRYYHYYGNFLLEDREWQEMLGKFLAPFYLVHPGYIGYQLMRGFSTLRLTKNEKYKSKIPEVIEIIN